MARILIGNIRGPVGPEGKQGPQGKQGIQGPAGPLPPLINNALTTEAGIAALDAKMGKTLGDQVTQLYSNFASKFNGNGSLIIGNSADAKIILQSADADNYILISFRDKPGNELAQFGYNPQYGICINGSPVITNSDLVNPYKTPLLVWGVYSDGTYTLSESIVGRQICVSVGNSGRLRGTWTPVSQATDIRSIVIPGGIIDVKILSATQVQITGTTPDYRVRDIVAL